MPVDASLSREGRLLYNYINWAADAGKLLSGQYTQSLSNTSATTNGGLVSTNDVLIVYNQTGKIPAILGFDAVWSLQSNAALIVYAKALKCILSCGAHWGNPYTGGTAFDTSVGTLSSLLTDETADNTAFKALLDATADKLLALQAANVPVLFKPLHEMNTDGPWFWWQNFSGADFIALWDYVQNYFTVTKGLHNILWVYNPFSQIDTASQGGRYPGASKVDVIAVNLYGVGSSPSVITGYGELNTTYLGKPFFIAEWGYCEGGLFETGCDAADVSGLVDAIRSAMPKCFGWVAWNNIYSMAWHLGVNKLLMSTGAVNADAVPSFTPSRSARRRGMLAYAA